MFGRAGSSYLCRESRLGIMRTFHWFFLTAVALFIAGLAFIIVGARMARRAPSAAAASQVVTAAPVASVRQIMKGIVDPAAKAVFASVNTIETKEGTQEIAPRTDAEWEAVGSSAAALIESANMILANGRAVDQGDWVTFAKVMIEGSRSALQATQAKNAKDLFDAGGAIYEACNKCHSKYQRVF
jgi:hypothetical protein